MGDPAARWPNLQEYQAAIIKAETDFKDKRLRGLRVQRHPSFSWDALPRVGNFGIVFKVEGPAVAYALKVFSKPQQDRQLRYRLIDQHLRGIPTPHRLVSFAYDETGIHVNGRAYPLLRMDWANGDPLDSYLDHCFRSSIPVDNGLFFEEWIATMRELHESGIAHGDLQHRNILVQADKTFRLVDYDGVFVPGMREHGLAACETGVAAYQHPQRRSFGERMDDFSALVILLMLACVDADLWERYHEDGHLLLTEADLLSPRESVLLTELSSRKGAVGTLAKLVSTAAEQSLAELPPFGRVISGLGMEWPGGRAGLGSPSDGPAVRRRERTAREVAVASAISAAAQSPPPAQILAPRPARILAPPRALSARQQQVLDLLRAGLTPAQIAARLRVQPETVSRHLSSIRAVIGAAEVRKLLKQAAAKPAVPKRTPAAPKRAPVQPIPPKLTPAPPKQASVQPKQAPVQPAASKPAPVQPAASKPAPVQPAAPKRTPAPQKQAPVRPAAPKRAETGVGAAWWTAQAQPVSRLPAAAQPVPPRSQPALPREPAPPPSSVTSPAPPKRASTGGNIAAIMIAIFIAAILFAVLMTAIF